MICRIGQWCVWPQDYHSIPAPQCWTDTLMDLMIEQIVLQQYPEHGAVGAMSCAAVSAALHHEITAEFATQVMSPHDASMFLVIPVNLRNHWQMIVLDVKEQIVHYYCSLHQHEFVVLSSLLSLVELSGKHIGCTSWRVETHDGAPMQTNAFDCGPFACLFLKHLLHAIDMNFSDRESAALRTDLKFMIDAVASPVVPATGNLKSVKPDGSTTQLTQFQQKFLDASAAWQSTDVDLQAVYNEMVESIVSGHNEPSSPKASRLQRKSPGKGGKGQVRQRSAVTNIPAWLNSASAVQKAFNSAPARTVNAILRRPNACPSFTATQVADHYFNLRPAVTSLAPEVVDILPPPATDHSMLVAELNESEVWEKMQKAPNSAPGADRINIRMLRAADPGALILTRFYRCCLLKNWVPLQWKQSVCKLLYKDGDKERLANWRPIALEPVLQRVLSAVVASRVTNWARANGLISSEAQKGFQPADGTSEHNFVMEVAIQEARRTNAQLAISWLDISNAFGTVSHQVLFSLLERYGLDPLHLGFIKNLYTDATIAVKGANGTHVTARWSVGVRQGDPCSGILFCLFVEPLLRSVLPSLPRDAEKTAVNVLGQHITALAYADDIALFAPSIGVMQQQLCKIQGMASAMGFRFNPKKCASLYLKRAVVNAATFTISGEQIPALVHGDSYRYLGVAAGLGKPQTPFSLLRENLREAELIFRSKLAPWQKMDAYRTYVLPRLTFQLTIAKFHNIKQSAGEYDRAILRLVKRCFQLPVETSTDFVRAPRSCGGLGVPSLRELYATAKITRALKMLWSPCQVVSTLATRQLRTVASAYFAKRSKEVEAADLSTFMNAARSTPLDRSGYPTCLWMDARKQMAYLTKVAGVDSYFLVGETGTSFIIRNGLGQTVSVLSPMRKNKVMSVLGGAIQTRHLDAWLQCKRQGKTASCVVLDRSSSRFITTGRYTSFAALRFALPARLDLLPCRARSSKRSYQNCRRCGYDRETLPHILQHCRQFSAPAYQARHDAVQGRLETVMRRRFPNLRVNRALPEIGSNKRPDLVVVDEDARSVILLDVAIVFENTAAAFVDARIRKWAHYEKEILAYRLQGYSVTYDAIVVGSLGTWDPKNDAILKRIGVVSERYLRLMKVLVVSEMLEHSSRIYRRHLGLRDLLPKTGTNRRPVGTTETDPPGGDLRQKKRNSISAKASGGKCLERRNTSPVGMPLQRGELQCQPSNGPRRPALAGTAPVPPRVQPAPTRQNQ
ncbi:Retrovirus-related Pol polyprotein from type-2 retrotransposable element R2DM [Trichinella zimbabwensis]|uniref:Retrovirus-related Pol polyprotein from type-2 retrotransposable element R2DM n=1 Tax=Trichinella zimbabwensis TaxID=268475 RepID=A0A0V1GRW2_9BILA|nr:Retrovirus-related Pol polyprotein from type-2 retrotransposable element R2DM [Trichinella zimbabwensis]